MPIANDVYNREGEGWWEEDNSLNGLHGSITPGRFAYFREVLTNRLCLDLGDLGALDIGCGGGGFLAEEFARRGYGVVGVDSSAVSIETPSRRATANNLDVDYRVGFGERLPVADDEFDLVYCCDVLEHVSDLDASGRTEEGSPTESRNAFSDLMAQPEWACSLSLAMGLATILTTIWACPPKYAQVQNPYF
jgi:2-polyprenyl-3-methyl-5-hydroxy-6-metoxy-1,4-benzoquinol methylase